MSNLRLVSVIMWRAILCTEYFMLRRLMMYQKTNKQTIPDDFCSIDDVANLLRRSKRTARNFVEQYEIPSIRVTKRTVLYKKEDIYKKIEEIGGV